MTTHDSVSVLSRALDQAGDVLAAVRADQLQLPTPCEEWTVEQLVRHLLADPTNFVTMMNGEQPDWAAEPPLPEDWAGEFRARADDLIHLWHQREVGSGDGPPPDMQTAEFAVHAWDLARAIGWDGELDPAVAEAGLSFMSASLKPEMRGGAFAEEVPVAADAPVYDRLVAFSGRTP